jgi:hypothetical protein
VNAFDTERQAIAASLIAAGVEAVSLDRGQAPPFVLVGMPAGTGRTVGLGAWQCEFPISVVWLPPGDTVNTSWALDQLQAILGALGLAPFRTVTFGDEQHPAYQLTYTRDVPNPAC